MDFALSANQESIKDAVGKICAGFDDAYWLKKDKEGGFPADFHMALAKAGIPSSRRHSARCADDAWSQAAKRSAPPFTIDKEVLASTGSDRELQAKTMQHFRRTHGRRSQAIERHRQLMRRFPNACGIFLIGTLHGGLESESSRQPRGGASRAFG